MEGGRGSGGKKGVRAWQAGNARAVKKRTRTLASLSRSAALLPVLSRPRRSNSVFKSITRSSVNFFPSTSAIFVAPQATGGTQKAAATPRTRTHYLVLWHVWDTLVARSAKKLEFNRVALKDCQDQCFPASQWGLLFVEKTQLAYDAHTQLQIHKWPSSTGKCWAVGSLSLSLSGGRWWGKKESGEWSLFTREAGNSNDDDLRRWYVCFLFITDFW